MSHQKEHSNWNNWYIAVAVVLMLLVILFYFFTQHFA
jgi:uncharacterized membrane protein